MSAKAFLAAMSLKAKVIIACAAVAVVSTAAVAIGFAVTKEDAYRVLKVFEMTGSAVVERASSGALDAYVGMNLESGDTLIVNEDSTLRISMDSDKYVLLDSGTVLELEASGTPADSRTTIKLKQGAILNEITNPLSANSSYEVSTPKATMAVRGTSFTVSVERDEDGSYITRVNTLQGKVQSTLLDAEGNPTDDTVLVTEGKGVTICTEPDGQSGNSAEVDGHSRFVGENEDGTTSELGEGEDPLHDIRYNTLSGNIKETALRSNGQDLMPLNSIIVDNLRGGSSASSELGTYTTVPVSEPVPESGTSPATTMEDVQITSPTDAEMNEADETTAETDSEQESVSTEVPSDKENTTETEVPQENDDFIVSNESFETTAAPENENSETTTTTRPINTPIITTPATSPTGPSTPVTPPTEVEEEKFEVRFMYNGELVDSVIVESGGTVTAIPNVPEKDGYIVKWVYNDQEFTSKVVITKDIEVTAKETEAVTVTFDFAAKASTVYTIPKGTSLYQNNISMPTADADKYYTSEGWQTGTNEEVDENTIFSTSEVLTPIQTIIEYHLKFYDTDEITIVSPYNLSHDKAVLATIEAFISNKSGYGHIDDWKVYSKTGATSRTLTSTDTVGDLVDEFGFDENSVIKIVAVMNERTLTWYDESGVSHSESVRKGSNVLSTLNGLYTLPTGYFWAGSDKETAIANDMTFTATNTEAYAVLKKYTVTFLNTDGTTYAERTVEHGGTVTAIPNVPEKEGYIITWVYNGGEFTSEVVITKDIEVTAEETEAVTVTFDFAAKESTVYTIPKGTSLYQNNISMPTADADKYYTSEGWQTGTYEEVDENTIFSTSEVLTPIQTIITYHFEFYDIDGTTGISPYYLIFDQPVLTMIEAFISSEPGYDHIDDWKVYSEDGTTSRTLTSTDTVGDLVDEFGFDENSVIKIVAVMNERTLTWYDESGVSHSESVRKGSNVLSTLNGLYTLPTGYFWAGSDKETAIANDMTFTATNTEAYAVLKKYTVTFLNTDGTTYAERTVEHGKTVTAIPNVPEKDGYIIKWVYNDQEFTSEVVITKDIEVTAEETEAVTVTFDFATKASTVYTIPKGTSLQDNGYSVPEVDAKPYFYALYWMSGSITDPTDSTVFDQSVTFTPMQMAIDYGLGFYDSDGTTRLNSDSTLTANYSMKVLDYAPSEEPSRNGLFDYWEAVSENGSAKMALDVSTTVANIVDQLGITNTIKIIAVYRPNVTVTFTYPYTNKDSVTYTIPKGTTLEDNGYSLPEKESMDKFHYSWDWINEAGDVFFESTTVNESIELTSKQEPFYYSLTFYLNVEKTMASSDCYQKSLIYSAVISDYIPTIDSPTSETGTFSHWEIESDDGSYTIRLTDGMTIGDAVDQLNLEYGSVNVVPVFT